MFPESTIKPKRAILLSKGQRMNYDFDSLAVGEMVALQEP